MENSDVAHHDFFISCGEVLHKFDNYIDEVKFYTFCNHFFYVKEHNFILQHSLGQKLCFYPKLCQGMFSQMLTIRAHLFLVPNCLLQVSHLVRNRCYESYLYVVVTCYLCPACLLISIHSFFFYLRLWNPLQVSRSPARSIVTLSTSLGVETSMYLPIDMCYGLMSMYYKQLQDSTMQLSFCQRAHWVLLNIKIYIAKKIQGCTHAFLLQSCCPAIAPGLTISQTRLVHLANSVYDWRPCNPRALAIVVNVNHRLVFKPISASLGYFWQFGFFSLSNLL